eukprot:840172-Prymnesium_polylepis.1
MAGTASDALYATMLRGALGELPTPQAPAHVPVLRRLKAWKENELIPDALHVELCAMVTAASKRSTAGATGSSSSTTSQQQAPTAAAGQKRTAAAPATVDQPKEKKVKSVPLPAKQQTLFACLPAGTTKILVKSYELNK